LRLSVDVSSDAAEVLPALRFLGQSARQPVTPDHQLSCVVTRVTGGYDVRANDQSIDVAPSPEAVLRTLFAHTTRRALALSRDHTLVHGAVVRDGPARALVIGDPGCGLTSLAVRLMHSQGAAEGDAFSLLGPTG